MNRRDGFTLVEILVAMAIFLFGVAAVLGLFQVGGGYEQEARARAELAPAIEPLIAQLRSEAYVADAEGMLSLRNRRGEAVPGAPDYKYDLVVEADPEVPALRHAVVRFYRSSPERVLASTGFLLPRRIPITRLVEAGDKP